MSTSANVKGTPAAHHRPTRAGKPSHPSSPGTSRPSATTPTPVGSPCPRSQRPGRRKRAWSRPASSTPPTKQQAERSSARSASWHPALYPLPSRTSRPDLLRHPHGPGKDQEDRVRRLPPRPRCAPPGRAAVLGGPRYRGGGGAAEPCDAGAQPPGVSRTRCRPRQCAGPDVSTTPLYEEPRMLVVPRGHPLADRASVTAEELADEEAGPVRVRDPGLDVLPDPRGWPAADRELPGQARTRREWQGDRRPTGRRSAQLTAC